METLVVQGVSKTINKEPIIKNISFEIKAGKIFGLLGPNGAGKTTLIKMIVGMMKMSKGEIYINGLSVKKSFEDSMNHVGVIVENPSFYERLSGYQNIRYFGNLKKGVTKERIDYVVGLVGLTDKINKQVKTYSLGMKQRLGLAVALLHDPDLLILDEPTNGLDPEGIIELREYIKKMARTEGKSILVSSHLLSEIEVLCDEIGIMKNGELVQREVVQMDYDSDFRIEVSDPAMTKQVLFELNTVYKVNEHSPFQFHLECKNEKELYFILGELKKHSVEATRLLSARKNLEQKFLEIVGSN